MTENSKIQILGQAEIEEIECGKGKDFSAMVRFYPMPEFDLPDLNTLLNGESDKGPRDRISLRLLELVSFDIPAGFVKDELAVDSEEGGGLESTAWQAARDRIRLMLILKQIAKQDGIEVDQRDVDNRIAEKAEEFGATIKELKAELALGDGLQRLKEMLLAESVLGYLMEINTKKNAEIKLQFDYDGGGTGNGGLATLYVDGEKVTKGRVAKTQPAVYSADETADVGLDESTQVADKVFTDVKDSDFTGYVTNVTISIPETEKK